jgi:hypothetical protein
MATNVLLVQLGVSVMETHFGVIPEIVGLNQGVNVFVMVIGNINPAKILTTAMPAQKMQPVMAEME